jgi:hypothetical protein
MADLEYRLTVKDDGSVVVTKFGENVATASKKAATATDQATKSLTDYETVLNRLTKQANMRQIAEEIKKTHPELATATNKTKELNDSVEGMNKTFERLQRTATAFLVLWAGRAVIGGISQMVETAINFNAQIEQSHLGIAAILMAQGKFTEATGQTVSMYDSLISAQQMSSEIVKQLQKDNLQTVATFDQLVKAFQVTLAPGLEKGMNVDQIRQYTVAMVQAAGAIGLNLDMMAEETRSLLRGTINPRNTQIATALGIRNEDIKKYEGDIVGLMNFLTERLRAFGVAGEASQKTFTGMLSNVKDAITMSLGEGFEGLFDYAKEQMQGFLDYVVIVNKETKEIKLNPEFVENVKSVGDTFKDLAVVIKFVAELSGKTATGFATGFNALFNVPKQYQMMYGDLIKKAADEAMQNYNNLKGQFLIGIEAGGQRTYTPNPRKLTEEDYQELSKIAVETGNINTNLETRVKDTLELMGIQRNMNALTREEMAVVIKTTEEWQKSTLPIEQRKAAYKELMNSRLDVVQAKELIAVEEVKLKVAETNKDYDTQRRLMEELSFLKNKVAEATGKTNPLLQSQQAVLDDLLRKENALKQVTEQRARTLDIINMQAKGMELSAQFEEQYQLQVKALDLEILRKSESEKWPAIYRAEYEEIAKANLQLEQFFKTLDRTNSIRDAFNSIQKEVGALGDDVETKVKGVWDSFVKDVEDFSRKGLLNNVPNMNLVDERAGLATKQETNIRLDDYIQKQGRLNALATQYYDISGDINGQLKAMEVAINLEVLGKQKLKNYNADEEAYLWRIYGIKAATLIIDREVYKGNMLANAREQLAGMTGDLENQNAQQRVIMENTIKKLGIDFQLSDLEKIILADLYRELQTRKEIVAAMDRAINIQKSTKELATIRGDFKGSKQAEIDLLEAEFQKQAELNAKNIEYVAILRQIKEEKQAQLKAEKDMDVGKLMDYGMKDYAMKTQQDLVNTYKNILPNAIDMSVNAFSTLFTNLTSGTMSASEAMKKFASDFIGGIQKMIMEVMMLILKMQILKALGYGDTSSVGGGLLGMIFGGARGSAGGGWGGGAENIATANMPNGWVPMAGGGIATGPTRALIGERGPEAIIPLKGSNSPKMIQQVVNNYNISAVDAPSFERLCRNNPNGFMAAMEDKQHRATRR